MCVCLVSINTAVKPREDLSRDFFDTTLDGFFAKCILNVLNTNLDLVLLYLQAAALKKIQTIHIMDRSEPCF